MDSRLNDLIARRRDAVQEFIDSRPDVFGTDAAEREVHAKECAIEDCSMCAGTAAFTDGWVLVIRQVTLGGDGEETWLKVSSRDMTWSRQIGVAEYIRDSLGR